MTKLSPIKWATIQIPLGDLQEWDKNPVQISERDARELAKSIDRFEHVLPYVAAAPMNGKKGIPLLDGHQRKMVEITLRKADPKTLVDVRVPSRKLSEKEREELVIRLRKNTGEFDFDKLANFFEVGDLLDWGFTEKELQFGGFDFENTSQDADVDMDRAGELLKKWKVKTGQLWAVGDHRLICGDCTDAATVARVMGGERAGIEIHDPPYGMRLDTDWSDAKSSLEFAAEKRLFGGKKYDPVIGDDIDFDPAFLFDRDLPKEMFLFGADYYADKLPNKNDGSWIVWDKRLDESADKIYGSCFELCWSMTRHKRDIARVKWAGVFGTEKEPGHQRFHPTQKPVELYTWFLSKYSKEGAVSADFYLGVGSHLVACENLGRRGRAIEISPAYVAVSLERMATAFPSLEIRKMNDGK